MSPQARTGLIAAGIVSSLILSVGCIVGVGLLAWKGQNKNADAETGQTPAMSDDLRESASNFRAVDLAAITENDVGKTVVVSGRVKRRTFEGFEGQQLLRGDKVMARMYVEFHQQAKAVIHCVFRPTNRKELLPEIETTVRVIGTIRKVIDYTGWEEEKRQKFGAKDEKYLFLEDCRFAR